ncbi:hypothetical protein Cfor_11122 [Coptotermes formosanus]|jgi:hypothetical protein|uniref:Uncharacterized protein n=1 Tax=Coptotermes formosanus TaxID=36987 RepID=A0A6L2QCI0_COPFO|nr:hypothetical protein Cfor_11122 [Coptotermes formosanus]
MSSTEMDLAGLRDCPFRTLSGVNCPWTGILSDIGGHVRSAHSSETSGTTPVKFKVTLPNISAREHYRKAVFIWNKLFYLIWVCKNATLYFTVFHFELPHESAGFKYTFRISSCKREVAVTDTCHSYLQDQGEVLQPGGCLTLHYSTVRTYLDQNKRLSCLIYIRGIHPTASRLQDITEYVAVASEISHIPGSSASHLLPSASSNHSPHSSRTLSCVISFLSFHLFCGFFLRLFFSFLISYIATYCT